MTCFPTNVHNQTAIYLSWASMAGELMRAGRGNSRKKLIEDRGQGMARVLVSSQVRRYQTACSLSADRHNLGRLFDTVCHFHVGLHRTIILNSLLIPDLSIRQIAFILGELNSAPATCQYSKPACVRA